MLISRALLRSASLDIWCKLFFWASPKTEIELTTIKLMDEKLNGIRYRNSIDWIKFKLGLGYKVEIKDFDRCFRIESYSGASIGRLITEKKFLTQFLPSPELETWLRKNTTGRAKLQAKRKSDAEILNDIMIRRYYTTRAPDVFRCFLVFEHGQDAMRFKLMS